jgi:Mn2+/Fe2+ NRAMP family transporter
VLASDRRDAATRIAFGATVAALVLLMVAAYLLYDSQSDQREEIRSVYGQRAEIATGTVDSIFGVAFGGQAREAATTYTAERPPVDLLDAQTKAAAGEYTAIVDGRATWSAPRRRRRASSPGG